jgi:hypothetical protein
VALVSGHGRVTKDLPSNFQLTISQWLLACEVNGVTSLLLLRQIVSTNGESEVGTSSNTVLTGLAPGLLVDNQIPCLFLLGHGFVKSQCEQE